MRVPFARTSLLLVSIASVIACRDTSPIAHAASGPSFGVTADTGPGGCASTQCHFNARGENADVNWSEVVGVSASDTGGGGGGGVRFGSVSVSRSGSQSNPQTLLFYNVTECGNFGCNTILGGFGTIPNQDFAGSRQSMQLNTNTSGNPNFFTFAGPSGTIAVSWEANGISESRFNGVSEFSQPGFRTKQTGQSTNASANASGSVISVRIPAGNFAGISTSHSVTIDINR